MNDIWQQEKNLTKAAKVLGELKSHLHTRESAAKTKVKKRNNCDEKNLKKNLLTWKLSGFNVLADIMLFVLN